MSTCYRPRKQIIEIAALIVAVGVATHAAIGADGQWGDLSGRFTYDGKAPPPKPFPIDKDRLSFKTPIVDESLIVNAQNGGIANVIVYLLPNKGEELCVHPSYALTATDKVELTMKNGRFSPHVLLLRTTQTMTQRNADKFAYNARIDFLHNAPM